MTFLYKKLSKSQFGRYQIFLFFSHKKHKVSFFFFPILVSPIRNPIFSVFSPRILIFYFWVGVNFTSFMDSLGRENFTCIQFLIWNITIIVLNAKFNKFASPFQILVRKCSKSRSMDKDVFIKLWNFLLKLYLPTPRIYFSTFSPFFFLEGVLERNLLN